MEAQEMMLKKLSNQISNSFKELETAEETYELHAICVHDGSAEFGHYFTFIKDHKKNIWRKFSDDKINIVD
jgi:ubiquitin carboxyl-terminal hydrolase 25/28